MEDNYRIKLDFTTSNLIKIISGKVNTKIIQNKCSLSLDSRSLMIGDIFLALKGNHTDGHSYLNQAFINGASSAIISNMELFKKSEFPLIYVEDTYDALFKIAKYVSNRSIATRIAITGSMGKTTTKTYLADILSQYENTYSSPASFNNKWGVAIALAKVNRDTKYGIFEVGMNKVNEIGTLSELINPDISIITNIGDAHIGNLGSRKAIAIEKSDIMIGMPEDSIAILPNDSEYLDLLRDRNNHRKIKFITFGKSPESDIQILPITKDKNYSILNFLIGGKTYKSKSKKSNSSIFENYMPILAVGNILDIDPNDILKRLEESEGPDGRWQDLDFGYNGGVIKLINDTYNASPESMTHAIKSVSEYRSNNVLRKIAIIGDMLELGKFTDEYHSRLVQVINDSEIDKVYFCGDILSSYFESINKDKQAHLFKSCNLIDIKEYFDIKNGDLFFFKGGNQIGLNKLVQDFINYLRL